MLTASYEYAFVGCEMNLSFTFDGQGIHFFPGSDTECRSTDATLSACKRFSDTETTEVVSDPLRNFTRLARVLINHHKYRFGAAYTTVTNEQRLPHST